MALVCTKKPTSDFGFIPDGLYQCIVRSDWEGALHALERNPEESRTWVLQQSGDNEVNDKDFVRFLPLHSACARDPPLDFIIGLLSCYPQGAKVVDDNGMLPLHYACANQASPAVIGLLLLHNSGGNNVRVALSGSLPIHLAAQWGVSSPEVMDMLLVGNPSLACAKDNDESTTLELAIHSEYYDGKEEVIDMLERAFEKEAYCDEDDTTISTHLTTSREKIKKERGLISLINLNPKEKRASLDTTLDFVSTLDQMRKEIGELRAKKALHQDAVQEQINREWGVVNNTIQAMKLESQKKRISWNNTQTHSKVPSPLRDTKRPLESRTSKQITSKIDRVDLLSLALSQDKLVGLRIDSRTSEEIVSQMDSSRLVSLTLSQDKFGSPDSYTSYESYAKCVPDEECKWEMDEIVNEKISFDGAHGSVHLPKSHPSAKKHMKAKRMAIMTMMATLRETIGAQSTRSRTSTCRVKVSGKDDNICNEEEKREYRYNQESKGIEEDRNLRDILEQNRDIEKELKSLQSKQNAYKLKVEAMEDILEEYAARMNVISLCGLDMKRKLLRMDNNHKATTATRKNTTKNMLKEMAKAHQEMKKTKPRGLESCMKKQKAAVHIIDEMLMIIRKDA